MDRGLGHLSRFGFEALGQVGCVARVFNYVSKATNATRTRCTMLEQYIFAIGTQSKLRTVGFAWDSLLPKDTYTYICNTYVIYGILLHSWACIERRKR